MNLRLQAKAKARMVAATLHTRSNKLPDITYDNILIIVIIIQNT